jgi:GGDEF domain-containing protein
VAFIVGIALLLKVGPVSQIYLMAIPVLAALLLGLRPALWTLALAGLVVMVLGFEENSKLHIDGMPDYGFLKAAIISLNFMFMTAVLTLSCAVLLQHLAQSLDTLRDTADARAAAGGTAERRTAPDSAAVARLNDMVLIARGRRRRRQRAAIIFANDAFLRRTGYRAATSSAAACACCTAGHRRRCAHPRTGHGARPAGARRAAELHRPASRTGSRWSWCRSPTRAAQHHWVVVGATSPSAAIAADAIHRLAFYDVLTGLPNRRLLMDRIDASCWPGRGARPGRGAVHRPRQLQDINDARGHAIGDALLCMRPRA